MSASGQRPTAAYSFTSRLKIQNLPGQFARITQLIAELDASLSDVTLLSSDFHFTNRDCTVHCKSEEHAAAVIEALHQLSGVTVIGTQDDTFSMHEGGKLQVVSSCTLNTTDELSRAYSPGVARVCMAIHEKPELVYGYTIKRNTVAVITDGTAVLGLGDIGCKGALPVMEGKAALFKRFAGIDSFPICIDSKDTNHIVSVIKSIATGFGGINLEDISAPRCFEIEERLQNELDIPVFHDDQHGTAVVLLAGLTNALKITGKKLHDLRIVVNGFGASGVAITRILIDAGVTNIIPCDSNGIVWRGRPEMNPIKEKLVQVTNPDNMKGSIADALRGADIFIGVSKPRVVNREMIKSMAKDPIVFALANPIPEILPDEIKDIARIIATGRSDYANQVNNVLCFPGIFRGALDCRATKITAGMKLAAAKAIAESVPADQLREDFIIPNIFQESISYKVAEAVKKAAVADGVNRPDISYFGSTLVSPHAKAR